MTSQNFNFWLHKIRKELTAAVKHTVSDGILFSGGLDSAILASLKPEIMAVSVSLLPDSEDFAFAKIMADHFQLNHHAVEVSQEEAIEVIPEVIKILKSFDPAIPNDLAVFFGLRHAKMSNILHVMTGDGSDELFAGYSYMQAINDLDAYLKRINLSPTFNSNRIGSYMGIQILQPYLWENFKEIALNTPLQFKIRMRNGKKIGKWILRKAFEDLLPPAITWQNKRPLEVGSGMTRLRNIIGSQISDQTYQKIKKETGIHFYGKDHLYYYNIFREVVGEVPSPTGYEVPCPSCGAGLKPEAYHCYTCGYVITGPEMH